MMTTYAIAITAWSILSVITGLAWLGSRNIGKQKEQDQFFVTRLKIYEMGYDCGFMNTGYEEGAFDFVKDKADREHMLLVYSAAFEEGLKDYNYLLEHGANLN